MIRVVDENGELAVSSAKLERCGGTNWEEEYLQPTVAPLTTEVVHFVCGGEPLRGAVKLAQAGAEIWGASGGEGVLVGERLWSVTVEEATRWSEEVAAGDLDVVVMRTKP